MGLFSGAQLKLSPPGTLDLTCVRARQALGADSLKYWPRPGIHRARRFETH